MSTTTGSTTANAATVGDIYVAFGSGDIPTLLDMIDDDVHWESDWEDNYAQRANGPAHYKPFTGKSGAEAFFPLMGACEFHDLQVVDVIGEGRQVVAQVRLEYTLPGGGRYRDEQLHLWTFGPTGKIVGIRHFLDTAKLLAATAGADTTASA